MVITTSGMCPLAKRRARRWVREEPGSLALFTRNRPKKSRKLIFLGLSAPDQQTTTITISKSFATKWKIGQPKNGDQFPHFCSFHVSRFRSFVVDLPRRSRDDRGYETQRDLFSPMEWSSASWKIHRAERMTKGPRKRWFGAGQRAEHCKSVWLNAYARLYEEVKSQHKRLWKWPLAFKTWPERKGRERLRRLEILRARYTVGWKCLDPGKMLVLFKLFINNMFFCSPNNL